MQVFVRFVSAKIRTFDVYPNTTIEELKFMILEKEGIQPD